MFMQVYLHKTVLSADSLIRSIFKRVSYLFTKGELLTSGSTQLDYFLREQPSAKKISPHPLLMLMLNWMIMMYIKVLKLGRVQKTRFYRI